MAADRKIDRHELSRMWAAGATVAEIMARFGCCRNAVKVPSSMV